MSEEDEFEEKYTPPELIEPAKAVTLDLLPNKSRAKYLQIYNKFLDWRATQNTTSFSENVLLTYFDYLSKSLKSSTLWSVYSMLKTTLNSNHNVHIEKYTKLIAFLKQKNVGYIPKKSKILTHNQVHKFLNEAPDYQYLASKAILSVGLAGALRRVELCNLLDTDVTEHDSTIFLVKLGHTKPHIMRSFAITDDFYKIVKKYTNLRPANCKCPKFFINYQKGKCFQQAIGVNKIGMIPKQIATYLNLPNPELYTGHAFRRTSASFLAGASADLTTARRHRGWKSNQIEEVYIEDSIDSKLGIDRNITNNISITADNDTSTVTPSSENQICDPNHLVINLNHPSTSVTSSACRSEINIDASTSKNDIETINPQDFIQSSNIKGSLKNISLNFNNGANITFNFNEK